MLKKSGFFLKKEVFNADNKPDDTVGLETQFNFFSGIFVFSL